ncbi:hypothetical protein RchiOBHm_Chr4g0389501 [Rosa chinensis]|uniref:Uncharacterized protein n=1 Tax=Rosa chinensis TaxID=74649 RepID=A0A2P6QQ12_ROSCH|nr:hypothetical protein RchiOBHm_Chr4g0389501 [Rosa chinensis]
MKNYYLYHVYLLFTDLPELLLFDFGYINMFLKTIDLKLFFSTICSLYKRSTTQIQKRRRQIRLCVFWKSKKYSLHTLTKKTWLTKTELAGGYLKLINLHLEEQWATL